MFKDCVLYGQMSSHTEFQLHNFKYRPYNSRKSEYKDLTHHNTLNRDNMKVFAY